MYYISIDKSMYIACLFIQYILVVRFNQQYKFLKQNLNKCYNDTMLYIMWVVIPSYQHVT